MRTNHQARWMTLLIAIACLAVVVGCGSPNADNANGGNSTAAKDQTVDKQAKSLLPAATQKSGTLKVATVLNWPPFTYKQEGAPAGIDIELISAIARTLGLKPSITELSDESLVPSIQNRRFDVAVTQLVTTPERRAVVDFVEYISNPLGLMVRQDDADKIAPDDLCGHTLVATEGTGSLSFGKQYSKAQWVAKGKRPVKFIVFGDSGNTILALANGRGEGFISDRAVGVYLAKTTKKKLTMDEGDIPGSETRSGIAFAKNNPQLGKAVSSALVTLMHNGTYQRILSKYGISGAALTPDQVNADASS